VWIPLADAQRKEGEREGEREDVPALAGFWMGQR
jgi:hypothetical protein